MKLRATIPSPVSLWDTQIFKCYDGGLGLNTIYTPPKIRVTTKDIKIKSH